MPRVLSLNISPPIEIEYKGKTVRTGIFKKPVAGRRKVNRLNIEGDGQADLLAHGGEMRAIYVYSHNNYAYWEQELGRSAMPMGQFGENLTVEGMSDQEVYVGDQYRIGTTLVEVSQPRVPCYKLAMKMEVDDFYARILKSGRLGFYFRVLEEGDIGSGDEIELVKRVPEAMNIEQVNALMYFDKQNFDGFRAALKTEALSPGWKSTFEDRLAKESVTKKEAENYQKFVVSEKVQETRQVTSFYLKRADGQALESYLPGQFLPIKLDIPGQYQSVYRTYTLSDAPSKDHYRLTIKRELAPPNIPNAYPGVSSNFFHDQVEEGTPILAATPRGKFYLNQEKQNHVVLLSAGVGITPMLSILNSLYHQQSEREVWFIHSARNGDEHIMKDYINALNQKFEALKVYYAYSQPLPTETVREDYHFEGRINVSVISQLVDKDSDFYICGPSAFMQSIINGLDEWQVDHHNINYEFFGPSAGVLPKKVQQQKRLDEVNQCCDDVEVTFAKSNIKAQWNPSFESILEFAESLGLSPDFSCRSGICQTCSCAVTEGEVEYAEEPLAEPASGQALICCSVPKANLTLEL